jgi:hypothetical protein
MYVLRFWVSGDNPVNELFSEVSSRLVLQELDGYVIRVQRLA